MGKLRFVVFGYCAPLAASIVYSGGVPSPTGVFPSYAPSVRIYDPTGGGQASAGTGTIFAASQNGSVLSLSIATAAHVIAPAPVSPIEIGFAGVNDSASFTVTPDSIVTASGGGTASGSFPGADLAYIGITIDLANNPAVSGNAGRAAFLTGITPDSLAVAPSNPGYQFSAFGYGISGSAPSGSDPASYAYIYHPANTSEEYGIERGFTNSVTNYFNLSLGGYTYPAGAYFLTGTGDGSGASLPGDSGSGMIVSGALAGITTFGPTGTSFCENGVCGYLGYNTGGEYGGVQLTQPYVDWLNSESADVLTATPEPASFLLAGAGVAWLLFRARRKSVTA